MSWSLARQPDGDPCQGRQVLQALAEWEGLSQQVFAMAGGAWGNQQASLRIKSDNTVVLCLALLCPTCHK